MLKVIEFETSKKGIAKAIKFRSVLKCKGREMTGNAASLAASGLACGYERAVVLLRDETAKGMMRRIASTFVAWRRIC